MGNSSICDNTRSNRSGNDRLKNRDAGVVPSAAQQSKLCNTVHTWERRRGRPRWLCCIWEREPLRPSTAEDARWNALACSAAHACQPASTSGLSCRVQGCRANTSATAWSTSAIWALCPGWRVRRSCPCQYIKGSNTSSAHWVHLGVIVSCVTSCRTVCHHKSTRAEMPVSCFWTLSKVSVFLDNPLVSSNVSIALSSVRHCSSTSFDVWRIESKSCQGCRMPDNLDKCCRQARPTSCQ